jgi:CheY-like chemotaxis protein
MKESTCLVCHVASAGRNPVKCTVLVVDDSPEIQRYLRTLLEVDSYRVETACNGHEALQRLRNGSAAQVILLDMQMPAMDGLETLRRLQEFRVKPKVIMCSGVDDLDKIQEALALGAQAYLVKPIRHLYLSAAIERCLNEPPAKRHGDPRSQLFVLPSPGPLSNHRFPGFKS